MAYRVAVATKDGKVITDHFGHCRKFSIVEVDEEKYRFIGFREVNPACSGGEHTIEGMDAVIESIKDCSYVLVNQIGGGAVRFLEEASIEPVVFLGFVEDGLKALMENSKKREEGKS